MLKALETLDKYNAYLSSMHNRILHSKQTLHVYTAEYRGKCLRTMYISFKMSIYISKDLSIYKWQEIHFFQILFPRATYQSLMQSTCTRRNSRLPTMPLKP